MLLSRFAKYYSKHGVESRTLIKAYGIRLDVIVHGHVSGYTMMPHRVTVADCHHIADISSSGR